MQHSYFGSPFRYPIKGRPCVQWPLATGHKPDPQLEGAKSYTHLKKLKTGTHVM